MDERSFKLENITLQYCLTGRMIADFFTKPLQGSLFHKFRDIIVGHKHISDLSDITQDCEPSFTQQRD